MAIFAFIVCFCLAYLVGRAIRQDLEKQRANDYRWRQNNNEPLE